MARFLEDYKPKKKKKEETKQPKQQKVTKSPSVTKANNVTKNSTFMGGGAAVKNTEQKRTSSATPKRQTTTPKRNTMTDAQYQKTYGQPRRTETSRTSTEKRQPTTRTNSARLTEAQRQKMGYNSMATPEQNKAVNRAIKNTPGLVKKAVLDTVQGHGQTLADITEMTASSKTGAKAKAMKMGIDPEKDKAQMAEVERERQRTAEAARLDREKWAKEQDERQKAWDKKVNGAGGLEKAYYGAVESGTGMLTDLAIGLGSQGGSLAAMFSRTYGTTRGQAEKEGATESEDRTYAFLQAAKEVGTELMFPGAGLARGYAKKTGLPLAERVANNLTKRIASRTAADLTGAGVRLLGGTVEENLEEVAGFGLDPLIKEFSYGRNVRTRQKVADLQNESDQLRANIQSDEDARRVASYLSSSEWLEQNKAQYKEAGLSDKDAQEVAEMMRDYMTASLTGDTETMDMLEQEIAGTLSKGEFSYRKSLDKSELLDTLASTTLLTLTTGLPGTATTAMRGSVIRDNLGEEGIRTLAESAMNYEDEEASKRGEVARDRLNAGQELTASQVYELATAQAQQVEKDTQRVVAKNNVVADTLESEKLVAPMIMRDDKGNIHGDAVITQRYNESAQEAESVLKDLDKEQKLSLSDSELAVGSRAIAGFQTGAFTINDANALNYTNTAVRDAFEKVTGVDLGQYVVKTPSGAVDYAATNAATKDALFTMAADNFIETARAETENFKDITKGITAEQMAARVGSNGDMAISTALDTVDPADEDTYGLMASAAQNVYEYGRYTEDSWDDVSGRLSEMYPGLSQEALQDVYEAAKKDKVIAETPYYNAKVTAGESTSEMDMSEAEQAEYGKFTNETGEDIGMKERAVLESIASEFNINIRLLPSEFFEYKYTDRNGKEKTAYSNGTYDPKTGTMLLNGGNDMERNIIAVALHEVTHHIAIYAPTEYLALSNRVMETWYKNDADAFNAAIQRKQENYKAQVKQNLSEEQALEEVIADAMGEMASDPDFISQICTEEPTLAEQIINAIKSVLRKLRAIMASGNVAEEHEDAFFNQFGIWDDAQRLWLEAAKVAQQHRAEQMIDEWDANARQRTVEEPETRHSINDADIMPEEETQNRLEENFDDYKEDKDNLRLATEAITDLQNVRYSVAENTSDISGRWSRGEQVRTIGKGITADLVNEGYVEFRGRKVKGPEDLAKLCQVLRDPRFETFRVVLTKGDKIVSLRSISSRLPGLAQAFESENISDGVDIVRDRMKRTGADGYYLIHNHPSGNVTASFADLSVTRAYLALLGQDTYKGHIILDHDKYGFIDADVPQVIRGENFPTAREESITGQQTFDLIHEPEIDHPLLGEEIHGHADIAKCGQFVNASDDVSVLLYTNSPGEVTGIQEISNKTLKNNKEITGFIRNQGVEFGAASAFLYTTDIETYQASKDLVKSGHLVDSVVAYGNNRQWSESAREVVSPRADVEVLGQVHDDVIRRTHVFESATGVTEYRYSLPETDNEGKALTQDQREFFRDVAPELLDDNGNIKRYFHGTARADRVGYYFNPERATSGPMAYFTDNRDIAANYSRDKADTSLAYEGEDVNDYHNQFVVDVDGEEVRLEDYWYQLPANKRIEYRERAGHITYDYDGEDDTALIIDENVNNGNGGYGADPYLNRQARGNAFRMLIDAWLDSGDFFNEEERFLEVMDLLGVEGVRYKDPNYRDEKVYEVYLNVTNPLVTTELDEEFAADVEDWLDATDLDYYARESASADMWDKNDRDPYDWLESLRDDIENGTTHVWTSIPDVITDFLKEQGYDGIVDQGGKYHEAGHQVVIPFEPNQIKLTTNEHPTEDVDIRYSIDDSRVMYTPYGVEVVQNPTDSEYRDMRNAFFDKYPWLRGTGEPPLRRTFDEEGNVYYWESSTMHSGVEPFINMRYNTRTAQQDGWWKGSDKDDYPTDYSALMARFSIEEELDKPYMQAVNSGNMGEAQRLVDEAAKMAGFDTPLLHHGTPSFGFTTFDLARGENIIFATNNRLTAETYSGETSRNRISEKSKVDIDQLYGQGLLDKAKQHLSRYKDYRLMSGPEKEDLLDEARSDMASIANDVVGGFIAEHRDAFDEEKLGIANRIVDSLNRISTAWNDDDVQTAWDDFQDAIWELKWADESMQLELSREIQSGGALQFLKNRISDFMYAGDLYARGDSTSEYVYDNQLALELGAELNKGIYGLYGNPGKQLVIDANGSNWNQIIPPDELELYGPQRTRSIAEAAKAKGYDSVLFKDLRDNGGATAYNGESDVYMFFNPNQVKSADPVTYAEDGSVIPLSERFDPTNNDIRYSLPTQDSDGNILTDGQMEYFKNSQARDRDGKLAVVYHTTNAGGFTVFDPEYSDDKRSLFFTSNFDMSQSYGTNAFRNIMRSGTDTISFDDFIKMDGPSISTVVATRLIDMVDKDTGEVVWDGTENPVGTGSALRYWYKKDPKNLLASVGGEAMDREGFDRWMNEMAEDELYNYKGHGYYACYLNLQEPLVIDCNGANWDSIPEPGFESMFISYDGESFYVDGTTVPWTLDELRGVYGVGFAESAENWVENNADNQAILTYGDNIYTWYGGPFDPENEGHWPTEENTRYWCNEAEALGYDGVIFRNLRDNGPYGNGNEVGDVYVAFNSNQVKDIRNENPTENPDIRYSIVDDEEAQSQMAYDDAMDTSYEALSYYETLIDEPEEQIELYAESFSEDKINDFYAGLNSYSEYFVFDDPVLEEGRKRMARSRNDFMERLNAEWNERWLTDGEILDIRSVRKDVREMVKSIMRNADTPNKVKNDIVNKTLIDIRLAYQFAKKGRIDVADALLWHTSMRMIEGVEFVNDDTFNEYKDLRDYLRTTRIQLGEEYWSDVDYTAFRKNNFGRMKLVKGETNVDEIYQEMCERWPEWFNEEEEMTPPDQLLQIEHVLDVIQPYKEAYSSEEAASIATDIAYDLSNIVYGKGRPYESLADKYKNRYDKQTQAMRQRHQEALNKVREQRDKGIKAERAKWQVREQKRKERQAHSKAFDSIVKNYKWLSERLLTNTKDKHIPEQYKKELAGLLAAFDLQTVGSKRVEVRRGQKGQKTIKMEAMKKAINNIEAKSEFFHVNDSITDIIDELLGRDSDGAYKKELSIEGKTIDELSVDELIKIDKLLKSLKHEFIYYETVRTGAKRTQAADIGTAQVDSSLKHAELFGPGKDYNNITGALDKILNMDEMTPAYVFKRIDPNNTGIGMMFKELRRSFDKYVKNQEQLNGWMEEILSPYHRGGKLWKKYGAEEIENWRRAKATNTFKLQSGDEIRLTPAQMMSVYCLAKRPQAYQHMVGAGIVIKPVTYQAKLETDFKRKTNWALPTILSDGDIKMISTALTPEQKQVADQLQQLMATKMAAWGNEASRAVIGIDLFEDPDYFPIQSDRAALEEDFTADQFVDMIRNFGFTKAVQPGARNAIAIDDIFTVVSTHCNNMNLYNAYSESMNDFMKVYNYHALREDGSDYSVKQAIAHAYSQKATTFISTFMRDLNGNVSKGRVTGIDNMMNAALGNAKKASVFANGRVALQQPTAIMRAFAVISPKYLKGIKPSKGAMKEMFEHCPIALWKSWGYYDINMGKSIEDIMMNNGNWLEDKMTDIYGAADNVTWTAIWQMCKAEVKDKNPKVKEGSDEFWDLVNERMSEVVDFTQVVDSPFHRSHAMRDKQILVKMATSFMAEPTLTFNMVRDGLVNSYEMYKLGDKGGAAKLLGKTSRVFVLSAFATAAAAAIWDAVRGKQPDGDDDEEGNAFDLWWANTIANFQDNLKLWNNIYYIKDIASLFDGWGTSNLALQGWKQLADGYAQLTGAYRVNSKKAWWENMLAGIGYLSGTPYGTILKDGKALLNIFGIHPSFLSAIGEELDSVQDMLGGSSAGSGVGHTSSNNESNNKKAGSDESDATSAAVKLWTYDNAPIKVEDGSPVDNFLNHFGVNLTASEILAADAKQAQKEHEKQVEKITKSLSEYSGEEYDKHLWDKSDLEGYGKAIEEGDFERAAEIEKLFVDCGGSQEFIDGKKLYHYKKNYVKSIVYDPTDAQIEQQTQMKDFLLSHGMSEAELSEKVYKSQTRKELQVAFRINDEDAIVEELTPLIRAGLSYDDFVKAYENRNRIDIKKYKDSDGKYAERLKSTGTYNWPVTGTITSNFGHRSSPGGIGSTNHMGLDIGASMGTPVGAADGGTVVYAGWDGGYGKCVRIEHDDGTITEYAHLSWWDAKVGDTVAQGQTIGNVGSTGNSTGPHLHFGVKVNGSYVDPLTKLN